MFASDHLFDIVTRKLTGVNSKFDLLLDPHIALSLLEQLVKGNTDIGSVSVEVKAMTTPLHGTYLGREVIASRIPIADFAGAVMLSYLELDKKTEPVPKGAIPIFKAYSRADALLLEDGLIGFSYTTTRQDGKKCFIVGKMQGKDAKRHYVRELLQAGVRQYKHKIGGNVPQLTESFKFLPELTLLAAQTWGEYALEASKRVSTSYYRGKPS